VVRRLRPVEAARLEDTTALGEEVLDMPDRLGDATYDTDGTGTIGREGELFRGCWRCVLCWTCGVERM
jgi:hypothetical protein